MTERVMPFEANNQSPEDTGFISREAVLEYKKRVMERKLWQYIDEWSEESLAQKRSKLEQEIETYKSRGRDRPDLVDELTIIVKATGVKRQIAAETQAAETSGRELADEIRRDLEIVERGLGSGSSSERIVKDEPIARFEQSGQSEAVSEEALPDVGPAIIVNGILTDVSKFTAEERRECVKNLRGKGEQVEYAERVSTPDSAAQHGESAVVDEDNYVRRVDLAALPEISRQMEELAEIRRQAGEPEMTRQERLDYVAKLAKPATVVSEDVSASLSMEEWTNDKQAQHTPSADDIRRGARVSSRVIDFVKKRPALTGIGFLAVAATIVTPVGVSQLNASPQEIATNVSLELPKGGIELASECITSGEYGNAPVKQSIDGVVPFDLKKPDGASYKFNDEKGTVRVGNDIVLTGAEAHLGACAVDEKEEVVSVDGMTVTIHRDRVKSQLVVAPSDTEGAIVAQPVDADMAGKLAFSQEANKEKLVSYFETKTFDALVGNSAVALGEGALKDEAVHAKLNKALDDALVKDLQDDIAKIAERNKVEVDTVTTELQGEYGQIEVLNVKKDIEGAIVMSDLVTVEVAKGK